MLKEWHASLMYRTRLYDLGLAGVFKKYANKILGANFETANPWEVEDKLNVLINRFNNLKEATLEEIAKFHLVFERIHPFQDGNGRIGRIIAFKECLKNNIVPFVIMDKDKLFYYRGLKEYQNKTEKGYLIDTCLNAQDQYARMIEYYLG